MRNRMRIFKIQYKLLQLFLIYCFFSPNLTSARETEPLVDLAKLDSTVIIDLKYATTDNFLGKKVYNCARCLLRKSVAERLIRVQKRLNKIGLGLKVWDAYRPLSVQRKFWEFCPDPRYVAPPDKGSRHNRGAAVDVTLVDSLGNELEMPTKFDDFSRRAAPDFPDVSPAARKNRKILIDAMTAEGFKGISSEWWHYDAPAYLKYPILDIQLDDSTLFK
ncbi:D-alanyl-D-alanine dipeptidase [candidate division KSB1 bacterium]|nr:D-alanyl-D-alanine dipeptidase [candidate division KSB1 bacterium]